MDGRLDAGPPLVALGAARCSSLCIVPAARPAGTYFAALDLVLARSALARRRQDAVERLDSAPAAMLVPVRRRRR